MIGWLRRCCHPSPARLLLYADGHLDAGRARRVQRHAAGCRRCRDEIRLLQETLPWLSSALIEDQPDAFATIRDRLVAQLREPTPEPVIGACARLCLGPRSLFELARRLRRAAGSAPAPATLAEPLLAAFVGRKALSSCRPALS